LFSCQQSPGSISTPEWRDAGKRYAALSCNQTVTAAIGGDMTKVNIKEYKERGQTRHAVFLLKKRAGLLVAGWRIADLLGG